MKFFFLLVLLCCVSLYQLNAISIVIPRTSTNVERDSYEMGLLKLILEKAGESYTLTRTSRIYTQSRVIKSLENNEKISIYWMGTSKELEKKLLPIRIPLAFGILGYRVFIIHKNQQSKFDKITTLSDLQKLKGAQGYGWSDNEILEYSGLKQHQNAYENIFKMVNHGNRIDYFSRGLNEAFGEVTSREGSLTNLTVEKKILLVYPFSKFFFISKENKKLEKLLTEGIEKIIEDKSFIKYFYNNEHIKKMFKNSNLKNRIRIDIPNPLLSEETKEALEKYKLETQ